MIYTIAEWFATLSEGAILFIFFIATLSYKSMTQTSKVAGTAVFVALYFSFVITINFFYEFEGIFITIAVLVFFIFSRVMLQGGIWHQFIVVILAFACIFSINIVVMMSSSAILQVSSSDVLTSRNPVRIFLLFITKVMLCFCLLLISSFFRKKKIMFSTAQCITMVCGFFVTLLVGVTLERIQIENEIVGWESTIIVICLIAINCLLFFVLYQFSVQNKIKMNHALLKVQIQNEQEKLQDSVRWSTEVETLRHDLQNHLLCISEYIRENKTDIALQYISKISCKVQREIPYHAVTKHPALNAILDLKRMVCEENQIDLKCFILEEMPDFDDVDLCVILANLFDNAIEAEMKEPKRQIRFALSTIGNYLRITIQNKISDSVLENNKNLKTVKGNQKLHGFGIQSVSETVQKNDGIQEFYEEDGWFIADIMVKIKQN